MSEPKFNKGPWKRRTLHKGFGQPYDFIIVDDDGMLIAGLVNGDGVDAAANGRLMKLAPQMYDSLERTSKILKTFTQLMNENLENAKAIINQAINIMTQSIDQTLAEANGDDDEQQ